MGSSLEVAIAAGGTAGHINPALALAEELRRCGHHVTFYGRPSKLEGTLVPAAGFELVDVEVTGFDRSRPWTAVSSLYRVWQAKRALGRRFGAGTAPDVAIGFGAYVEVPLLGWCSSPTTRLQRPPLARSSSHFSSTPTSARPCARPPRGLPRTRPRPSSPTSSSASPTDSGDGAKPSPPRCLCPFGAARLPSRPMS